MRVVLEQGPEGSPNFCFGLYACETGDGHARSDYVQFVQFDWDYAGLASALGWVPCECGRTDGTFPCAHRSVSQMLAEAFDYLAERDGLGFDFNW
jgi:hypothetical protein